MAVASERSCVVVVAVRFFISIIYLGNEPASLFNENIRNGLHYSFWRSTVQFIRCAIQCGPIDLVAVLFVIISASIQY